MLAPVKRICLTLSALALISACKGKPAPAVPDAATAEQVEASPGGWTLTLPMVEGYLRYQRTLLVQAGKIPVVPWDGGLKKFEEEPSVEQKATLDDRARLEAGLTPDDVMQIESMLSRVSARRMTYQMMKMDERMPDLPEPDPNDPTNGADLAKALETQTRMKKAMQDLPEEREMFGSRNIDVMLQREEELLKNWALMMQVPELAQQKRR
jgi:hypothetical protein